MKENYIASFLNIFSGGKYYQKDGERRGYEPEVFSRIFWEQTKAEEEEERFVKYNISAKYSVVEYSRPAKILNNLQREVCISIKRKFGVKDKVQYIDSFTFMISIFERKRLNLC